MRNLLELLNIELPIIQAPMAGVSTPEMAAAVADAGALGSISVAAVDVKAARDMIMATRKLTQRVINVNVFCHRPAVADARKEAAWVRRLAPLFARYDAKPPERLEEIYKSFVVNDEMMDLFVELRPQIVSFHFGLPPQEKIDRLKELDTVLLGTATNLDEAQQLVRAGIDAVVAQGYEAGGHRGMFLPERSDDCLSTAALVQMLVRNVDVPVIAAGGIMDGAGIVAALDLGAIAAQLGTAFVDCPESSADSSYRAALRSQAAQHTVMTKAISGRAARGLQNLMTKIGDEVDPSEIPDYPIAYHASKSLHAAAKEAGEGGYGAQWAGQGAPLARSLPAGELVRQLKLEMDACKPT